MLDPAQLFNQALTALERGNRALAVDRLERVLEARPDDCEAAVVLAKTVREDGDLSQAETILVGAIKAAAASPADPIEAYLELADVRLALGKPGDAARAVKRVLAAEPNNWEALYLLGNAFVDVGALAEAENAYRQAIATNPFDAEVWFNLAIVCERLGQVDAAAEAHAMHERLATGQ